MANNSSVETGVDYPMDNEKSNMDNKKSYMGNKKYDIGRCLQHGLISDKNFWSVAFMVHVFLFQISSSDGYKEQKIDNFELFLAIIAGRRPTEKLLIEEEFYKQLAVFFSRLLDPNDFTTWCNDVKICIGAKHYLMSIRHTP